MADQDNIATAARMVLRWRVRDQAAEAFQHALVGWLTKLSRPGLLPKVVRPLEIKPSSLWSFELDFENHSALGSFVDGACADDPVAREFLSAMQALAYKHEGVQPDEGGALVASVLSVRSPSTESGG